MDLTPANEEELRRLAHRSIDDGTYEIARQAIEKLKEIKQKNN